MGKRRTPFPARLWNDMYDHLQSRAKERRLSMNDMLNQILMDDRERRRSKTAGDITSVSNPSALSQQA